MVQPMYSCPDHPVIRNMEATGYPDGKGPAVCCCCSQCGGEIYEGDTMYEIRGEVFCEDCIDEFRCEAELPEPDYDDSDY